MQAWSPSRKLAAVVLVVAAAIAIFAASSSSDDGRSRASTDADELAVGPDGKPLPGSADAGADASADGSSDADGPSGSGTAGTTDGGTSADPVDDPSTYVAPELPLEAQVEGTKRLQAGDVVTVTVDAEDGSLIYGLEMRMCKAGTVVRNDGDMLPSVSGNCISKALSPGADAYKVVPSAGDRSTITATYTVGTGTDTYPLDDGGTGSVTCDADHPCVLAVKYQIPDGFGFRTYPLTFS